MSLDDLALDRLRLSEERGDFLGERPFLAGGVEGVEAGAERVFSQRFGGTISRWAPEAPSGVKPAAPDPYHRPRIPT
eukprot:COSAG05_NODE_15031_length_380_cov_0.911032_1_plen_76_part_10